jgi:hypothetical protein
LGRNPGVVDGVLREFRSLSLVLGFTFARVFIDSSRSLKYLAYLPLFQRLGPGEIFMQLAVRRVTSSIAVVPDAFKRGLSKHM